MFKRPRHQLVSKILAAFDAGFLRDNSCYFGGGTRIAMELDEYRESMDIDLLCADIAGYRTIRTGITDSSLGPLVVQPLPLAREVRADMYGIRTFFDVDGEKIKFEIVFEARINLTSQQLPGLSVPCLDRLSCFAEKLLANTDRWADRSVLSRDIIDLAFMASHWGDIPQEAWTLAENAYGTSVRAGLSKAIKMLQSDSAYFEHCISVMAITETERLKSGLKILGDSNAS